MTRVMNASMALVITVTVVTALACSKPESTSETAGAPAVSTNAPAEITFKSDPETPKMGDNSFEVMAMQDGKPVNDAQVSVEFFMAAMPAMKMPEMRTQTDLTPAGNGVYKGSGQVTMAGSWDVTVMVMKNGQEIASKKLTVAAK